MLDFWVVDLMGQAWGEQTTYSPRYSDKCILWIPLFLIYFKFPSCKAH